MFDTAFACALVAAERSRVSVFPPKLVVVTEATSLP